MTHAKTKAGCSSVPFDPPVGRPDWSSKTHEELADLLWDALCAEAKATERMCRLEDALIEARKAHVLRLWDDDALAIMDAALAMSPNVKLTGARASASKDQSRHSGRPG